ncbi:protein max isoform X1 [Nilaparvata lugens]|uniref:protein max isoform X1 n=1 Tax=Nilaparvata lugens TaxID=108931 RepID=UPI000B994176|nr:protein max isoform X1 [Nilaparvata lugens]
MSDDDRDIDIESAEKRAHHNALERKRRDHIKDSFSSLRDSVPALQGEKVDNSIDEGRSTSRNNHFQASRAQILKKAADYIQFMRRKNSAHQQDIDDLRRQNSLLESQIRTLEKSKPNGNFAADPNDLGLESGYPHESGSDTSDSDTRSARKTKKLKVSSGL